MRMIDSQRSVRASRHKERVKEREERVPVCLYDGGKTK